MFTGARLREQSEIQRGKVHHRAGSHDQGQRLGVMESPVLFIELCGAMTSHRPESNPTPTPTTALHKIASTHLSPLHAHTQLLIMKQN